MKVLIASLSQALQMSLTGVPERSEKRFEWCTRHDARITKLFFC
jgi:hypothetical protein